MHVFTLSHSAGQPCYTALPQRPAGDSCSHLPRQDFSSSTFRPTGQNKREMLSPFPFPSLRRLLFKETLPSKKELQQHWAFPPDHPRCHSVTFPFQGFAERCCVEDQICSPEICWFNKRDGWNKLPDKERALPVVGRKWDFTLFPLASFKNSARNWCKLASEHLTHKAGKWETVGLGKIEQRYPPISEYTRGFNVLDQMVPAIFPWDVLKGPSLQRLQRIISPEKSVKWFLQPQKLHATGHAGHAAQTAQSHTGRGITRKVNSLSSTKEFCRGHQERVPHCWVRVMLVFDPIARAQRFLLLR